MITCDPAYKALFVLCFSVAAATVSNKAGLQGTPYSNIERQSHQVFLDDYQSYLADNEEHPWCGTGRIDEYQVDFLVNDGKGGVDFITEDEYKKLIAEGLKEA